MKREITSAISNVHRLRVADLFFVPPGSLPITTSGKVRRSSCAEQYRKNEFERRDTTLMTENTTDAVELRNRLVANLAPGSDVVPTRSISMRR